MFKNAIEIHFKSLHEIKKHRHISTTNLLMRLNNKHYKPKEIPLTSYNNYKPKNNNKKNYLNKPIKRDSPIQ
jgi:hypothetical protein